MISGHFSSFSSLMPILSLVEKVARLFYAKSDLIMSLPTQTINKSTLNHLNVQISKAVTFKHVA